MSRWGSGGRCSVLGVRGEEEQGASAGWEGEAPAEPPRAAQGQHDALAHTIAATQSVEDPVPAPEHGDEREP